jgi:putative salt-induced outer membrane protein
VPYKINATIENSGSTKLDLYNLFISLTDGTSYRIDSNRTSINTGGINTKNFDDILIRSLQKMPSEAMDYRRANGVTSRERYLAGYEPRYQFDPRGFAYGLTQFERDTSIGYDERYTGSVGIGYKLIVSTPLDLQVDIGPSVRHAKYLTGERETKLGARGSMAAVWRLSPTLTLKQTAAGYAESDVYSFNSLTAVETKVAARLSAALSYNVQYESETLLSARDLDTLSRLTLTYDF